MKYMGSKRRIAKEILPIMLKGRGNRPWVEPFVGGANVIDKVGGYRIGGDSNPYLIELYKKLQNGYTPPEFISREDFYRVKLNKEEYPMEVVALCGILASYNGNWFRAYGGYSATKTGGCRNYYKEGVANLMRQLPSLLGVDFYHCGYNELSIPKDSIIYCDPPYSETADVYKDKKFNHELFWEWCKIKHSEGHRVFISEKSAPDVFRLIWEKELQVTHPRQRFKHTEKLFTIETNLR